MKTTREIVEACTNPGDTPCAEGLAFADAHPDPFDAITAACAGSGRERLHVRWMLWQDAAIGWEGFVQVGEQYEKHHKRHNPGAFYGEAADVAWTLHCAELLREWLKGYLEKNL